MTRAAIYARYSSDRQSESSVDDQVALCRRAADARGLTVVEVHGDAAISGAVARRPGLDALLASVQAGRLDVVLVESLDRLGRDLGDLDRLRKTLGFRGVRLLGVSDGVDTARDGDALLYGVRAVLSEAYLADLAKKTHRGLAGRAAAAKVTGGLPFGYRSEPARDGAGKVAVVDEPTAAVVRQIFDLYGRAGASQAEIAEHLNRIGAPAPRVRAGEWRSSAVRSILINPKYRGEWTWNAKRWVRDPDTRTRRRVPRPETDLVSELRPELAIVDDETWALVAARFERQAGEYAGEKRRRTYPLTGLLVCGCCGAPMSIAGGVEGRRYYRCSMSRSRGRAACGNRRNVREDDVRATVFRTLERWVLNPDAQRKMRMYAEQRLRALAAEAPREVAQRRAELAEVEAQAERLVDLMAAGLSSDTVRDRLRRLEEQKRQIREIIASAEHATRTNIPSVQEVAARASQVTKVLASPNVAETRETLRNFLAGGTLSLTPEGENDYRLTGALKIDALLTLERAPGQSTGATERATPARNGPNGREPNMGAGARTALGLTPIVVDELIRRAA